MRVATGMRTQSDGVEEVQACKWYLCFLSVMYSLFCLEDSLFKRFEYLMMLGFVISAAWGYALFSLDLLVLIIQRLDWDSGILLACEDCPLETLRMYGSYVLAKILVTRYSGMADEMGCYRFSVRPAKFKSSVKSLSPLLSKSELLNPLFICGLCFVFSFN